jgi:Na+-translocating ferredoxin:NAD+ oxidoreductase RnfG subunit
MKLASEERRRIFLVGGALSLIGGLSALLIGAANLLTAPVIAAADSAAQETAMKAVYGDFAASSDPITISGASYVSKYWVAFDQKENALGYIYRADGKNKYGSVALLVGVMGASESPVLGRIALISDTETFKEKLEGGYVDPYNADPTSAHLEDTTCGATHGAALIHDMVTEAKGIYDGSIAVTFADASGSSDAPSSVSASSSAHSSSGGSPSVDASAGGTAA